MIHIVPCLCRKGKCLFDSTSTNRDGVAGGMLGYSISNFDSSKYIKSSLTGKCDVCGKKLIISEPINVQFF